MSMVRELLGREEIHVAEAPSDCPAMSIGETTPEFLNACCRLVDLLDSPQDIPFLSGLIQREIIFRILRGPEGARSTLDVYTQTITPAKHAAQAAVVSLVFSSGANGGSFFADRKVLLGSHTEKGHKEGAKRALFAPSMVSANSA
jgi:hypothetical protein